ncbi:MAG: 1-deoxy-D-xylulose-5-phosphate synthase [Treponema sp.]|jgi:transketolase|nr:1-deoxy-D-xylulose-5-phosphate synthase [Treponema sp.]
MSDTMRDAFGKKLAELGKTDKNIVVLDADVSGSTKSSYFATAFPDRFFNCGVAEGNLAGVAAGLAASGFHPVINAFAIFLALKSTDQIRNDLCYNKLPVVIAGAYGGLSDSFDGASHQSIADIAIFRALPNMEVIVPADNAQAEAALEYALARQGPVYIRLNRNEMPSLTDVRVLTAPQNFAERAPVLLRKGYGLTIAASGITASAAQEAAELLAKSNIDAEVFSVPFVKPAPGKALEESVRKTGTLVTVEEHNIMGGAGSAWLEDLSRKGLQFSWLPIGMEDSFGETGPYTDLLDAYGLSAKKIADKIKKFVKN